MARRLTSRKPSPAACPDEIPDASLGDGPDAQLYAATAEFQHLELHHLKALVALDDALVSKRTDSAPKWGSPSDFSIFGPWLGGDAWESRKASLKFLESLSDDQQGEYIWLASLAKDCARWLLAPPN